MTGQVLAFTPHRRHRAEKERVHTGIAVGMSQLVLMDELHARGLKVSPGGIDEEQQDHSWLLHDGIPQHFCDLVTRVRAAAQLSRNELRRSEQNEK